MRHELHLHKIGPINDCRLTLDTFTILTGPQANGKSTVAKAVYFFRSVKQDILSIMMQGGPKAVTGGISSVWHTVLKQRMKDKFLQLFGTSWVMPSDMMMEYQYSSKVSITVSLDDDYNDPSRNYIVIDFSKSIEDYLAALGSHIFTNITPAQKEYEEKKLNELFHDPYESVFIPAGRNLLTLLSTQLNYIFTSLEDSQLRNIDYVTKRYTELILRLKPVFAHGMEGVANRMKGDPTQAKKYERIRPALNILMDQAKEIMKSTYRYVDGEERLYLSDDRYVKINLASSGQQEVVWVFNLLFYYLSEDKKIFLIIEEPESHLYPESQRRISETLSLMVNSGNSVLVTTHSPYVLGTFNYLLMAGQIAETYQKEVKKKLRKRLWLNAENTNACYIRNGGLTNGISDEDNLQLIKNELIDGASTEINDMSDYLLGFLYAEGEAKCPTI